MKKYFFATILGILTITVIPVFAQKQINFQNKKRRRAGNCYLMVRTLTDGGSAMATPCLPTGLLKTAP